MVGIVRSDYSLFHNDGCPNLSFSIRSILLSRVHRPWRLFTLMALKIHGKDQVCVTQASPSRDFTAPSFDLLHLLWTAESPTVACKEGVRCLDYSVKRIPT